MRHAIYIRDLLLQRLAHLIDGLCEINSADEADAGVWKDESFREGKGALGGA